MPLLVPALLALAPPAPPTQAPVLPTQKALELFKEGRIGPALDQLDLAIARDAMDPQPLWIKLQVFEQLSRQAKGWEAAWYRECAEEAGDSLLDLPDLERDLVAQAMSLLQHLHDGERPARPDPGPAATRAFEAGEAAFGREAWEEAHTAYGEALKACPTFAEAALFLGDVYFSQNRMEEAIPWFRKAAELNPASPQAWRFLADAQTRLGRTKEAEATLMDAIRVFPANRASWRPLASLRKGQNRPMARLAFRPGVGVGWSKEGKQTIFLSEKPADPAAQSVWMLLASSILDTIKIEEKGTPGGKAAPLPSRFQEERHMWDLALSAYEERCQKEKQEPKDRVLRQFLAFRKEGQLDAALFLLRYREAFRPDFETWLKANPQGVEAFLERYNLRP